MNRLLAILACIGLTGCVTAIPTREAAIRRVCYVMKATRADCPQFEARLTDRDGWIVSEVFPDDLNTVGGGHTFEISKRTGRILGRVVMQ